MYCAFEHRQLTRNLFKVHLVEGQKAFIENMMLETINAYTPKIGQVNYYEVFYKNKSAINQHRKGWVNINKLDVLNDDIFVGRISRKLHRSTIPLLLKIEKRLPRIYSAENLFQLPESR